MYIEFQNDHFIINMKIEEEKGGGGINEFGFVVLTIVFENLLNVWFLSFVYIYREREREFKFDIFQSFLIDVFI